MHAPLNRSRSVQSSAAVARMSRPGYAAARLLLPSLLLLLLVVVTARAEVYPPPELAACINSDMSAAAKPKYTTYDDFVRGEPSRCVWGGV